MYRFIIYSILICYMMVQATIFVDDFYQKTKMYSINLDLTVEKIWNEAH